VFVLAGIKDLIECRFTPNPKYVEEQAGSSEVSFIG
jgi:hypothetical protein